MMTFNRTLLLLLASNALASIGVGVAMIAVPWVLAGKFDNGVFFGILITGANIALALLAPWTGVLIDSTVRQRFMVLLRLAFIAGLGVVVVLSSILPGSVTPLILYYLLGAAFYAINIPLRTAFVQELYSGGEYAQVNSILEVENQVAAVLTGALAILLIDRVGLTMLALANALVLVPAIICIVLIKHEAVAPKILRGSPLKDIKAGFAIMKRNARLSVVLLVATLPYVVVILYTYLHPVALSQLLNLGGDQYALVEVLFAVGSIIGGGVLLSRNIVNTRIVPLIQMLVGFFGLVAVVQAILPAHAAFLAIAVLFGLLNAAVRILRQTLLMQEVEPHEIGRVGAFIQSWIMLMRALFLGLTVATIAVFGIVPALWVAASLPLIGWLAMRAVITSPSKIFSDHKEALQ